MEPSQPNAVDGPGIGRRNVPRETEKLIQNQILVRLSREPDTLVWRQNVGLGDMVNRDGSTHKVKYGVPGMADIGGICSGIAIQLEVKTATGKQTEKQVKWQKAVERAGGIYAVCRSVADAEAAIQEARWRTNRTTAQT